MANMDPVDEPVIQPVIVHGQDAEAAQQQDQVVENSRSSRNKRKKVYWEANACRTRSVDF